MASDDVKIIFGTQRHELCIPVSNIDDMRALGEALLQAGAALIYVAESPDERPCANQQTFDWAREHEKISS